MNNPTLVDYTFEWGRENPEITVVDANGAESAAQPSADRELTWEYPLPEDGDIQAQFGETAIKLGTQVAKYISQDGKKKSIERICAAGSPAEAIFDNLHNRYTTPHKGVDVQNAEASQFYRLADNCFTCHVSFDYILHTDEGDKVYPTAYTFCVVNRNGKYRLYNMLSF